MNVMILGVTGESPRKGEPRPRVHPHDSEAIQHPAIFCQHIANGCCEQSWIMIFTLDHMNYYYYYNGTVVPLYRLWYVHISTFITVGSILYVLLHGEHAIKYILIMPRFVKTFTFLMSWKYGKLYARLNIFYLICLLLI